MRKCFISIIMCSILIFTMQMYLPGKTYAATDYASKTYCVDITWSNMQFDFHSGEEKWDTENYKWENKGGSHWEKKSDTDGIIKVTNKSSSNVNIKFDFQSCINGVSGTFTDGEKNIDNNKIKLNKIADNNPDTCTVDFMPLGNLPSTYNNYTKIGQITITMYEENNYTGGGENDLEPDMKP